VASGVLNEAIQHVVATINGLGYKTVTDPRNARPLSVFVELPTFTTFAHDVVDITIVVRVLAPPPGNQDASDYIITIVDAIQNAFGGAAVDGRPTVALIGEQQLPAYDLTIRLGTHRST
jgi:hypothetical protein